MRSAVVTVVSGRYRHLTNQRRALRSVHPAAGLHVVVAVGDPEVVGRLEAEVADDDPATLVVSMPTTPAGLPLAAARNAGARAALARGAQLLVFLDVDCLPATDLLTRYTAAALERPAALLCGPVTYLPADHTDLAPDHLHAARNPHPARPDPPVGDLVDADPALFWSLSFAVTGETWERIGGFDEGYVGYGAEDTDFARRAARADIGMVWVGGADAYHQHHPTADPPAQHVDAILRNGARYAQRWGEWPMHGWLTGFERLALVHRSENGWVRERPVRLATVPAHHPYVDAVRPTGSEPVHTDRVTGWEPDPFLSPDTLSAHAAEIDVLHLHFGFEHLTDTELAMWLTTAASLELPIVLTVHDLRNPHLELNERHDEHLRRLVDAADEVITLTASAAAEIGSKYGRVAQVLPHPTIAEVPPAAVVTERISVPEVVIALGALRRNVCDPAAVTVAALAGAVDAGAALRVGVRREAAGDPRLAPVRALADEGRIDLVVHERFTDDELVEFVRAARAIVLPYRFGTHSGWVEVARDVGTHVVAPSCGHYADQWPDVATYTNDERRGLDPASLRTAVCTVLARPPAVPAERAQRLADRERVRAAHEVIYRRVMRRP